jgi:hypothetical protein
MDVSHKMNMTETMRGLLTSLAVNGIPAFIIYIVLKNFVHTSDLVALLVSGVPATIYALIGVVRQHRIDLFSGFMLAVIVVGVTLSLISGNARLVLLRHQLIPIAIGVAYLGSLIFPKPLWFYVERHMLTGNDPQNMARFNAQWQYPYFRFAMRFMTLVWGGSTLLFAALYIVAVLTLPIALLVLIVDVEGYAFWIFLLGWTGWYVRRMLRKLDEVKRLASVAVADQANQVTA